MGKEELIQYFEDAIALETEIITQENLVSQFEAMSENKKPVLVERKVQVAEPDANGLDSETNAATFFLVTFTVIFLFAQLMEFSAAEPSFWPLIGMAIIRWNNTRYLPARKEEVEGIIFGTEAICMNEDCNLCRKENENRKEKFVYNQEVLGGFLHKNESNPRKAVEGNKGKSGKSICKEHYLSEI